MIPVDVKCIVISYRNQKQAHTTPIATAVAPVVEEQTLGAAVDWVPEPNEPRYCLCNQVSIDQLLIRTSAKLFCSIPGEF